MIQTAWPQTPSFNIPPIPSDRSSLTGLVRRMQQQLMELHGERRMLRAQCAHMQLQLQQASRLQRDLLPGPIAFDGLDIHTLYQPADQLSGDIYDVAALDENQVGISLADAAGHGAPAALLSVMLKRPFRGRESTPAGYRILPPQEVLRRVNREMLEANLHDGLFVTGLHAVFNRPTGDLTFARGGLPFPILLKRGEQPRQLTSCGPILGALDDAIFEQVSVTLEPGDSVIFYTDGVEALLLDRTSDDPKDSIVQTGWYQSLSQRPVAAALADIAERLRNADPESWPVDDVSMIALVVR